MQRRAPRPQVERRVARGEGRLDALVADPSCLYWAGALDAGDAARGPHVINRPAARRPAIANQVIVMHRIA